MSGTNSQSNNPTEPVVIAEPVTVDGTVDLGNQFDDEYQILCDSTPTTFLRRLRTNVAGAVTVANFTLAGGAFVPVGAVGACATSGTVTNFRDDEYVQLCDSTPTPFLRRFRCDAAGAVTVTDLTLAGAGFVPVGAVGLCPGSVAVTNRRDLFAFTLCDTVTSFIRRFSMNDAGVVSAVNTTLDGVTPYVPVGAVSVCGLTVTGSVSVTNRRDTFDEILCDTVTQFLRRYTVNDAGVVSIIDTTLDGTTAYVTVGAITRCVTIISDGSGPITVDGSVGLTNQFDDEWAILCDATPTTFLRRIRTDLAGTVTIANFTLAGGAFVPVGAVGQCGVIISDGSGPVTVDGTVTVGNQRDDEWEVLCDAGAAGAQFLRRYRTDSAGVVTSANFLLDGTTAYVVLGAVTRCTNISGVVPLPTGAATLAAQRDDEYEVLCDAGAAGLQFLRRYRTDSAGVVTIVNTTLDGTTAYVVLGVATACRGISGTVPLPTGASTLAAQRDDEYEILCDTVTTFLRRYRTDSAGVVTITDTTLNGTTAYVVVGAVTNCAGDSRNDNFIVLCDNAGSFLRRYAVSGAGVLTVTNLTLAGGAYVPVGTVTQCGENTGSITVTLLSGVASIATSVLARRITFVWGSGDATAANRPSINGVATLQSPTPTASAAEQINTTVFGSLDSPNTLPSITFATNLAGDSANVIQEF